MGGREAEKEEGKGTQEEKGSRRGAGKEAL